ncbi:hypothetical protein T4B_3752 [Trichinella pseudospiralis]|uniref:Uncharacterized protein n=2 Tax=Trichinella pseudospiralis TaxID=6337 RepID=A0A0V1F748_TRIPS|nr:hypothetical protein T4A_11805 [Trichinella pseudospiralis]KRY81573.1 hypothetical protein T4D_12188 [Trichinella pseudospiralis]KRY81580.1 hypothetical protein T4D_3992 [Trichinella pseudospiralis]KRZ22749.1 hypothetical protein T4B_3752 [Trichinella pseudospiralis]
MVYDWLGQCRSINFNCRKQCKKRAYRFLKQNFLLLYAICFRCLATDALETKGKTTKQAKRNKTRPVVVWLKADVDLVDLSIAK